MALGDSYISPDDLAEHLAITVGDHDTALARAALAASQWVDGYCGRTFNLADEATARYYDAAGDYGYVWVDDIGHATITVATDSSSDGTYATAWETSDFQGEPFNALSAGVPITTIRSVGDYTFPEVTRRRGLVSVTARWGWPSVPETVKLATLIQGARLFKRKDSPEGVLGGNDFGVIRVTSADRDVADLLDQYRLNLIGIA